MREAIDRRRRPTVPSNANDGDDAVSSRIDEPEEDSAPADSPTVASPEAFFADLTARADVREFLKRLADR